MAKEIPARSAMRTRSASDSTPIFSMIRPRCTLIVFSTVPRSAAICLLSGRRRRARALRARAGSASPAAARSHSISARAAAGRRSRSMALRTAASSCSSSTGLVRKSTAPRLHRPHAGRDVALSGDEDDRAARTGGRQRLLQLQPVRARAGRHRAPGNRASPDRARPGRPAAMESRGPRSRAAQQPRECPAASPDRRRPRTPVASAAVMIVLH